MPYELLDEPPKQGRYELLPDAPRQNVALDKVGAVASGFNQGVARLLGAPADTLYNIADLLRAANGVGKSMAGGKLNEADDLPDRATMPWSGDWILHKLMGTKLGQQSFSAPDPNDNGGYLQTGGGALAGIVNPTSKAQLVNQVGLNLTGALGGKAVADATGNPGWGAIATLLPGGVQQGAIAGTKRLIRGSDANIPTIQQRIQDLQNAGIDSPTLGLATGNKLIGGIENLLQNTPGAVGIMSRNRDAALAGMQNAVNNAAEQASGNRGATAAGASVQAGGRQFRNDFKATQGNLYDALGNEIGASTPTGVDRTLSALSELNSDIPQAERTSQFFKNGKIVALENALSGDASQNRPYSPSQLRAALDTQPDRLADFNAALGVGRLPFEAVKKTRTLVGNEIADSNFLSEIPRSKWNPLYGALSQDMQAAAAEQGPAATAAFNRANNYTRAGVNRLEAIEPIIDRTTPEQTFSAIENALKSNPTNFQALKKSLPENARGDIAGTIIEDLGKAAAGQQDANGGRWSPETFLTNWNKLNPKARDEMLSGYAGADEIKATLDAVAKSASMMRDNSKMWNNPSGTGANIFARGTLGGIGLGTLGAAGGLNSWWLPAAGAATVGAANLGARALTSPNVVNSMASRTYMDPRILDAQIRGLIGGGLLDYPGQ